MTRHSPEHPCPICGGHDHEPRGEGKRCFGFISDDGGLCICTREECAGGTKFNSEAQGWEHFLRGDCPCGRRHGAATASGEQGDHTSVEATYDYRDESGTIFFQVVRYSGKKFLQRRPDGRGGWIWNVTGVARVLYRLPELLAAPPDAQVFIVEGEKDADAVAKVGLVVTTNPGGAGKWRAEFSKHLANRAVVIIADKDEPGRRHAKAVAAALHEVAASVKVIEVPGDSNKDAADFLASGGTAASLVKIGDEAAEWTPPPSPAQAEDDGLSADAAAFLPFPVDVLPDVVGRFVTEGAAAIGCDEAFIALPLLAALASGIGNARRISLKRGWTEPAVIWSVVVADSGQRKSPAQDLALHALRKQQAAAFHRYEEELDKFEIAQAQHEAQVAEWKRSKHKGEGPPPEPAAPRAQRFICSDVTVEALAPILADNPRGVLLARDELAGWIGAFDAYKRARGADSAAWLEVQRAGQLLVDRKTGERTIYVPRAAVSVCGSIQPEILARALGREYFENGMAARMLLAMPPRTARVWRDADIDPMTLISIENLFDALLRLQPATDEYGEPRPVDLPLTSAGREAWIAFYNAHGLEQEHAHGDRAAALSKLEGYAARLALVIHSVRQVTADPTLESPDAVDERSVSAGVSLVEWFKGEVARVYAALRETDDRHEERRLVELIRKSGGRITPRELMRRANHETAEAARQELDRLVQQGLGRWERTGSTPSGGRPTVVFVLGDAGRRNDRTDTTDTTPPPAVPAGQPAAAPGEPVRVPSATPGREGFEV